LYPSAGEGVETTGAFFALSFPPKHSVVMPYAWSPATGSEGTL